MDIHPVGTCVWSYREFMLSFQELNLGTRSYNSLRPFGPPDLGASIITLNQISPPNVEIMSVVQPGDTMFTEDLRCPDWRSQCTVMWGVPPKSKCFTAVKCFTQSVPSFRGQKSWNILFSHCQNICHCCRKVLWGWFPYLVKKNTKLHFNIKMCFNICYLTYHKEHWNII